MTIKHCLKSSYIAIKLGIIKDNGKVLPKDYTEIQNWYHKETKWYFKDMFFQSPDFYGILASGMVGRFKEKVGRFG